MTYKQFLRLIGQNIQRIRAEKFIIDKKKYTKRQCQRRADVPSDRWNKIENGTYENFEIITLLKIAKALDVDIDELCPMSEQKRKQLVKAGK